MQRIVLTRSLLTELARCDRAFVMSLFWHNLDNDSLEQKGGVSADSSDISNMRHEMMMNMDNIKSAVNTAGGVSQVSCSTTDPYEKVRNTEMLIAQGGPRVIVDGMIEGNGMLVGFAVMVINEDGMMDVYHLSSKSGAFDTPSETNKALANAQKDAAPLLCVLAERYPNKVKRFGVIGANKHYLTPYPDPKTGKIIVDPDEAMYCIDIDVTKNKSVIDLFGYDPSSEIERILAPLSSNPFAIPEAELGSKCRNPYTCPFYTYCKAHKDPNSVFFYLPSKEAKKLEENGYETMEDLLELSYSYPTLENIPTADGNGTFTMDDIVLRNLRSYEQETV